MKTAFIIHGTGGSPEGNWFQWLGERLMNEGYMVIIPRFPTPEGQSLQSWSDKFEPYKKYINDETIFVAHSSGPAFVLSILETLVSRISACFFAAGFQGLIDNPDFDRLNKTITNREFDWDTILKNCQDFYMCHGSDDPYVPLENSQMMSKKLAVEIDIIKGGGHLNAESGHQEFAYLHEKIMESIGKNSEK